MSYNQLEDFKQPPVLRHLKRLTTPSGLIQHTDRDVPDPSFGYSIDDNARALIACLWYYQLFQDHSVLRLAEIYFHYIEKVEKDGGSFHNFLSFSEKVLDSVGSEDSNGRAIWALGETIAYYPDEKVKAAAKAILGRANLEQHLEHPHVRAKAYILLGLLSAQKLEDAKIWADRLVAIFEANATDDWPWFEDGLYYANGILPYALAKAAISLGDKRSAHIAKRSFAWLDTISRVNGTPSPIGQDGWYRRGGEKALHDQQPLEAANMILAATALWELTGDKHYLATALDWHAWYQGNNTGEVSVVDEQTGGIFDAVTSKGVNKNEGAEPIVTYLLAYLALTQIADDQYRKTH